MSKPNIARILYDAYPHSDLLPLDPDTDCRDMDALHKRVFTSPLGDGLFTFLVIEIMETGATLEDAIKAVERARHDLDSVLHALEAASHSK
jgi:hypothetical protein